MKELFRGCFGFVQRIGRATACEDPFRKVLRVVCNHVAIVVTRKDYFFIAKESDCHMIHGMRPGFVDCTYYQSGHATRFGFEL
jgi:hypothetical protein